MFLKIRPAILSGGAGTRMWPLSRRATPKQFHALTSSRSLLQETVLRTLDGDDVFSTPIILANSSHASLIIEQLQVINVDPEFIILEPAPRNTAPAIAALAVATEQKNGTEILAVLPADHTITDGGAFREALKKGAPMAENGNIVTFGVTPTRPETGYGYIRGGEALDENVRRILSFEEKPDLPMAQFYVDSGNYYWNAGIFIFRSDVMIAEMQKYCPAILEAAEAAVSSASYEDKLLKLDSESFAAAPEDSIDYAVMERTEQAAVAPMLVGWSDIGSWATLWEIGEKDGYGNTSCGDDAVFLNCSNTLAVANGQKIAAIGVTDLLIVATSDGILVTHRDMAQDVKTVVKRLKSDGHVDLL